MCSALFAIIQSFEVGVTYLKNLKSEYSGFNLPQ